MGYRPTLPVFVLSLSLYPAFSTAQDSSSSADRVRIVANSVLRSANFPFIDEKSGASYLSTAEAQDDAQLQIESPYNDWRYWNGVLNIAMLRLGEELHDTSYTNFVVRNIAFDFDNCKYFEERYRRQDKWTYPS